MRKPLELAALNFVSYFTLTADIRSVAQGNIPAAVFVNMTIALLSFTIFKRLQEAKGWPDRICYAVGGTVGTVCAILVTKAVFHQ